MNRPRTLRIERSGVHILWADGHLGYYPHWYLRAACQCADCLEGVGHNRMAFYETIPEDVKALDWRPVGQYAVQLLWSEGHDMGIYAFETLRRVCRCEECVAKAVTRQAKEEGSTPDLRS